MSVWAIILAAGQGSRLAKAGLDTKKQFLTYEGAPLFWKSIRTMVRVPRVSGFVIVFPQDELENATETIRTLAHDDDISMPCLTAAGGERRQDSVRNGLTRLPKDCTHVLVHDAARPFASARLVNTLIDSLRAGDCACIPAVAVKDTIKRAGKDNIVAETIQRQTLRAVQTPQGFKLSTLREAHEYCETHTIDVTDDASMVEALGKDVRIIEGEENNIKITTPEDLEMLREQTQPLLPCVGWGYDVHRFGTGRPLRLGGIPIDGDLQVVAHSDGDVLLHALADAILGCLGKGDIGQHFPDSDAAFDNIESSILVNEVMNLVEQENLRITHVDLTVITQKPKLAPYRKRIRNNVAKLLKLSPESVNFKATTEEGLGFTGRKQGIKAVAAVTGLR